jgi:hypothetical protein
MRSIFVPCLMGFVLGSAPAPVDHGAGEYAGFLAQHDQLHPQPEEKKAPELLVRKAFWDDHERTLFVNAETTTGKGTLIVVEGLPGSDWLTAFHVTKTEKASFEIPIPQDEMVPCRIMVRSAHAYRVTRIVSAPPSCVEEAKAENMLLARL